LKGDDDGTDGYVNVGLDVDVGLVVAVVVAVVVGVVDHQCY